MNFGGLFCCMPIQSSSSYDCAFMKINHFYDIQFIQSLARGHMGTKVIIQATIWFATKCFVFTLRVCGVTLVTCLFTTTWVDKEHTSYVPSSTSTVSLNAPSMQEGWSFNSDMGLFLNCDLSYQDLEDPVTIFGSLGLLLHHFCFAAFIQSLG